MLVTGCVEIEALIVVLLTALRAGVPIMSLNGKSRLYITGERCSSRQQNMHIK
jgi:hypothetical protein